MARLNVKQAPSKEAIFKRGELILQPKYGTIFFLTGVSHNEAGKVKSFDGVAMRHNNYDLGSHVRNVEIHPGSEWVRFEGTLELAQ